MVKKRIAEAKKKFLQERIALVRSPKIIWDDFRRLGLFKSRTSTCPANLDINGLNDYFVSVGSVQSDNAQLLSSYRAEENNHQFKFVEVTPNVVQRNLSCITTSVVGPDGFSIRHYKLLLPYSLEPIVNMINGSLASSQFPNQWKDSWVIPIPTVCSPQQYRDYRPISILCPLSKVLERCVYEQLISYISLNNLLDPYQTGFREGMNTQTALVRLCDDVRAGVDDHLVTIAVFFDFTKAFDCIDHHLLLEKLKRLNLSAGVSQWFSLYLSGRRQAVKLDDALSSWNSVKCGVPQGSVLGPLLYAIFVTELGDLIDCKHLFYADDLVIYSSCKLNDIDRVAENLNGTILVIVTWCCNNLLRLNAT
ncbi:GSCOCG00011878001-RA-CDS [Cotesia congregata]|nr:GSCOCG00011878001-RA-CDS [Cotesia congregata]